MHALRGKTGTSPGRSVLHVCNGIGIRRKALDHLLEKGVRPVVDYYDLEVDLGLKEDRTDRMGNQSGPVVDRNHHRHGRFGSRFFRHRHRTNFMRVKIAEVKHTN
jgi:hypothetical protein